MSRRAIIDPEGDFIIRANGYDFDTATFQAGSGSPMDVSRFDMATAAVQFSIGAGGGNYTLQGSIDGSTYVALATNVAASQVFSFSTAPHNHFWRYLRVVANTVGGMDDMITLGAHEFLGHGG